MKDAIVDCLARQGWHKDKILDFFNKPVDTFRGPERAAIWLRFDRECNQWWLTNGDFTSAGENVLATSHAIFPLGMDQREIEQKVDVLVVSMDHEISRAFSVRMIEVVGRSPTNPSAASTTPA